MYGLFLEGLKNYITLASSSEIWSEICESVSISDSSFLTRKEYDEELFTKLLNCASEKLNLTTDEMKFNLGQTFVEYMSKKGYQWILKVLGRKLRDFINGMDNLHEFLRSVYPNIQAPSCFCVNESKSGITLQYRSYRNGFVPFFQGWMIELCRVLYDTHVEIDVCIYFANINFKYIKFYCLIWV